VTYYYGSGNNQPWLEDTMGIVDWTFRGVPDEYFNAYITDGVWNSSKFSDPEFDAAVKGYMTTVDEAKRRDYARQGATILMDGTPAVIPYTISVNRAMRQNVMGVSSDPAEFLDLTTAFLA
jgi:ABC-type transport system substrate-binding protein